MNAQQIGETIRMLRAGNLCSRRSCPKPAARERIAWRQVNPLAPVLINQSLVNPNAVHGPDDLIYPAWAKVYLRVDDFQ